MVHIVASPNWYKCGPRFDSVAITFEETRRRRGAAPETVTTTRYAKLEAIFYTSARGGEFRAFVRYYEKAPMPHQGYAVCIYELYTLSNLFHIIDIDVINDHSQMIPNFDHPGLYYRDNTVIRDMFE